MISSPFVFDFQINFVRIERKYWWISGLTRSQVLEFASESLSHQELEHLAN